MPDIATLDIAIYKPEREDVGVRYDIVNVAFEDPEALPVISTRLGKQFRLATELAAPVEALKREWSALAEADPERIIDLVSPSAIIAWARGDKYVLGGVSYNSLQEWLDTRNTPVEGADMAQPRPLPPGKPRKVARTSAALTAALGFVPTLAYPVD